MVIVLVSAEEVLPQSGWEDLWMIVQPARFKGLYPVLGNLVYLATVTFPSLGGLALALYSLAVFGPIPTGIRQRLRGWIETRRSPGN